MHVTKAVADRPAGRFKTVPRGVEVKGAGLMDTFFLEKEEK